MVPSQFWFRILLIVWSLISTTFFFALAKRFMSRWPALLATLVFVVFSSLPWLEGHIPNGELFVTGFLLTGMWLARKAGFWKSLEHPLTETPVWSVRRLALLFVGSFIIGLGLLTKVPAILDMGAIGAALFFSALSFAPRQNWIKRIRWVITGGVVLSTGFLLPLLLSIAYFTLRGAGAEYLQFGLLYNFHYTGNWTLPFTHPALLFAFSLPGKAMIMIAVFLATLLATWKYPKQGLGLWVAFWLTAALFGSLLSNRPYPHYLIQLLPPATLAVGMLVDRKSSWLTKSFFALNGGLIAAAVLLLGFAFYESGSYYSNAWKLLLGRVEPAEYRASFNSIVLENEKLAAEIQSLTAPEEPIFIWGTNPMLYAQSQRSPATRFTVAFHIHDLKNYDEMFTQITTKQPQIIVVMKEEQKWDDLNDYLETHYIPLIETDRMILHHRRTKPVTWLLQ
jgi:4-amino-4-deoxy-L-arabinose transferase-like glycosyltransferase